MLVGLLAISGSIWGQSLQLQVDNDQIHAGLPFTLSLTARGFDQDPQPEAPQFSVEGAEVSYLGVSANVSSRIQIFNGRRSERHEVTYVYRWRIVPSGSGDYVVPSMTVVQGNKKASVQAARFTALEVESTSDMMVRLDLPDRPVWVGETFDIAVEWLLRRDVGEQQFVVPLFELEHVRIEPLPIADRERSLTFQTATGEIRLPLHQDQVTENRIAYTRFRFPARMTVTRPGPLDLEPTVVAASLKSGTRRDNFGFRVASYELFKAEDERRTLVVRPLPVQGRPASFENAIGSGFSLDVQASRTVVQVGDPVELTITVRGDGPLEGLSLPALDGPGGLPRQLFSVLEAASVGIIDAENNAKAFEVTVRIRSAEVREIPPIEFAYFDPARGEYGIASSRPVALSVGGSNVVSAADVVAAPSAAVNAPANANYPAAAGPPTFASLIGADMSLATQLGAASQALSMTDIKQWLGAVYATPMLIWILGFWRTRTRGQRGRKQQLKTSLKALEAALKSQAPARDSAPLVINALRALARCSDDDLLDSKVLESLENVAYDPRAGQQPISTELAQRARVLARSCIKEARNGARTGATLASMALLGASCLLAAPTYGDEPAATGLTQARLTYQNALGETDRIRRTRLFTDAQQQLRSLVQQAPNTPDLLTDWGNAALGAQDLGSAVLAYRRALSLDPGHQRAGKNLAWIRDRTPSWLPRPSTDSALDSLFFWHHSFSVVQRQLIGAAAFALAVLLMVPWSRTAQAGRRRLAIGLLAIWVASTGSALFSSSQDQAGVIINDGSVLRSADSLGAPPAFGNPLPAGAELRILEIRDDWTRVELHDGTLGWVSSSHLAGI